MSRENFDYAIEKLLKHEGGYVDDPYDPGGETKYGISKRTYPHLDIKSLTEEDARQIYYNDWWRENKFYQIDDKYVAYKTFDLAVNMGASRAIILAQRSLNNVWRASLRVDGVMGPNTLREINDVDRRGESRMLYIAICHYAANYYESLGNRRYLRGWLRRAFD